MADKPFNLKQGGVADRYLAKAGGAQREEGPTPAAALAKPAHKKEKREAEPKEKGEDKQVWQPTRVTWVPAGSSDSSPNKDMPSPPEPDDMHGVEPKPKLPFHNEWVDDRKGNTPRGSPAKKPYNLAAAAVMAPGKERTPEKPNKVAKAAADGFVELWKHLAPARAIAMVYIDAVLWWWGCVFSLYIYLFSLIVPLSCRPPSSFRSLKLSDSPPPSDGKLPRSEQQELLSKSATEMAQMLRDGDITSTSLVEACIARVTAVHPVINAAVAVRFEEARKEAAAADKQLSEARAWKGRRGSRGGGSVARYEKDLPALLGVPFSLKEAFQLEGMPNTSGLMSRMGCVATRDAPSVARLRAAGAIPICSSNCSELCMWYESYNNVYGLTSNPYNTKHSAGGSSGGEGALVASSCVPFGLASDVAGSIRLPACFNGCFGHKPTGGLVPNVGQHPCADGDVAQVLSTGPITRSAQDLLPLLRVLATPSKGEDPSLAPPSPLDSTEVWGALTDPSLDLRKLRVVSIGSARHRLTRGVTPEVTRAQHHVAAQLEALGATVEHFETLPCLARALEIWGGRVTYASLPARGGAKAGNNGGAPALLPAATKAAAAPEDADSANRRKSWQDLVREGDVSPTNLMRRFAEGVTTSLSPRGRPLSSSSPSRSAAAPPPPPAPPRLQTQFRAYLFEGRSVQPTARALLSQLLLLLRSKSNYTLPALLLALIECIPEWVLDLGSGGREEVQAARQEAEKELEEVFTPRKGEEAVVLLMPTFPSTAPRHFAAYLHPFDFVYCALWNALEMPATHVPVGLSAASALPLGVQIVAPRGRDSLSIAVAVELEKAGVARWTPPQEEQKKETEEEKGQKKREEEER